jgi:acyl carrier protein
MMRPAEFYLALDELLELPLGTIAGNESLEELETWDSLAVISFIALVDEQFGNLIESDKLAEAKTTGDLYRLATHEMAA